MSSETVQRWIGFTWQMEQTHSKTMNIGRVNEMQALNLQLLPMQ